MNASLWPRHFDNVLIDSENRWWKSFWNRKPSVTNRLNIGQKIIIKDDTLREGILAPGAGGQGQMSIDDRIEIARALDQLGISEAEVGYTVRLKETIAVLKAIKKESIKFNCSVHTKLWGDLGKIQHEVASVIDAGADYINYLLFWDVGTGKKTDFLNQVRKGVRYAKKHNAYVAFGTVQLQMKPEFFKQLCQEAVDAGADRIVAYDGHGCSHVTAFKACVVWLREWLDNEIPIEVHCHNDFGLATAETLAAVEAGAEILDVSINGLGNRAGIGSLEEVVMALTVLYDIDLGLKLNQLFPLSRLVQQKTNIPVQPHKPIVGKNCTVHESAVHIQQILVDGPQTWEVYKPEIVGQSSKLVFGGTSLENDYLALRYFLKHKGLDKAEAKIEEIATEIRRQLEKQPYLYDDEVINIAKKII
ncbi:MAG: hypothetical protein ACFFCW_26340 [Candidatus Hodarchaeota archaeon]